jgi:hypothetical protein
MVGADNQATGVATPTGAVTLSLPAQPHYVRLARLVGAGLANELDFDLDGLDDVRLAVGEACALAIQAGAPAIHLAYALADGRLSVTGDAAAAPGDDGWPAGLDGEQLELVDQILRVACRDHHLSRDERGLTFRLIFGHGT